MYKLKKAFSLSTLEAQLPSKFNHTSNVEFKNFGEETLKTLNDLIKQKNALNNQLQKIAYKGSLENMSAFSPMVFGFFGDVFSHTVNTSEISEKKEKIKVQIELFKKVLENATEAN